MSSKRLKQPAQSAQVYIRSSEYILQLPVQYFYGILECEEVGVRRGRFLILVPFWGLFSF